MIDVDSIARAAKILRQGGVVAFPTETVYGLGADATDVNAVSRIFAIKGRPTSHPLIVHLGHTEQLDAWADDVPPAARRLAERGWPGPLSLVLRRSERVPLAVTGGLETVALRVPAHPVALALLREFGGGLAAPSANRFGSVSPTTARHVEEDLGDAVDYVVDGGPCDVGVESTIVDFTGAEPAILRPGGLTREAIELVLGQELRAPGVGPGEAGVRAPGQHPSHYAPRARVLLVAPSAVVEEAGRWRSQGHRVGTLALAVHQPPPSEGLVTLTVPEADEDYARTIYGLLREFDRRGCELVIAALPPERGLGLAIADRLRRAAAPRG